MNIAPADAKAWAKRLENARALTIRWPLAEFSPRESLVYLVGDGTYTTSIHGGHWANHLQDVLVGPQFPGSIRGFSYSGYGEQYLPEDTAQPLLWLRSVWRETLQRRRAGQRLIPVCFSLGAAVALLGTCDWVDLGEERYPAATIPAIVLVAPAHSPSPTLLAGYQQLRDEGTLPAGIPASLSDLADPRSPVRKEAAGTFGRLASVGIQVHVIYWPGDIFTAYEPTAAPGIEQHPILQDQHVTHPRLAPR
jgi:hypothetical protein